MYAIADVKGKCVIQVIVQKNCVNKKEFENILATTEYCSRVKIQWRLSLSTFYHFNNMLLSILRIRNRQK